MKLSMHYLKEWPSRENKQTLEKNTQLTLPTKKWCVLIMTFGKKVQSLIII